MKVGTDGTLLGAWAQAPSDPCRILDIGTGTGLIALMLAQRYPYASVVGIDIESSAVAQAKENVRTSPFLDRVNIYEADIRHFTDNKSFDAIVCNPPFFANDLVSPDKLRAVARHTITMGYQDLIHAAYNLLSEKGCFSVVLPTSNCSDFESEAIIAGFSVSRICYIKTKADNPPKRCLIELKKTFVKETVRVIEVLIHSSGLKTEWYYQLTRDFYLE